MYSDNVFNTTLKSIDEVNDLHIILYKRTEINEDCFYLMEQSSLQVLTELSFDYSIEVQDIFSQRHRIAQKVEKIKSCSTLYEYLDIVLPLVENGSFPCDILSMKIEDKLYLESHDDGDVTLISKNKGFIRGLVKTVLTRQGFNPRLLDDIIRRPNLYHKIERPNIIKASFQTFEEVIDDL